MEEDEPLGDEVLATIRVDGVRYDQQTGRIDVPLHTLRQLADWVRRYDLRPGKQKQQPWQSRRNE